MHLNANDSSSFGNKSSFFPFITYFLLLYGNKKKREKEKAFHTLVSSQLLPEILSKSQSC